MRLDDGFIFLFSPLPPLDIRVQMVVPSFSALLPDPSRKESGDQAPVLSSVLPYHLYDLLVLFWRPWPFYEIWIQYLLPSVETLNISSVSEVRCYLLPILSLKVSRVAYVEFLD